MVFETTPLGELMGNKGYIRGPFGSALKRAELKKVGIPVYEQQHAIEGIRTFRYFIDDDKYSELRRFTVEANDLIISCSGTVGRISVIQAEDPKGIISQALLILRPDINKILPYYLYYFLTSKAGTQELVNASHGAVQLNIAPRNIVEKIPVPLPANVEIQRKIIWQLKVIDEKIDLNRRINQTLETMAQAIFKSWFVDFDPVKAKIAAIEQGQDPLRAAMCAISGKTDAELGQMPREHHNQLAATAALFPDAMEESELGEIPKGWKCMKAGDFVERLSVGKKFDQKSAHSEGSVPILDQGKSGIIGFHDEAPGVKASLECPVVVFANHTCYMRLITFDFSAIQNVLPFCGRGVDTVWAYYATKGKVNFSEYKGHWPDFVLCEAIVPPLECTRHFKRIVQSMVSKIRALDLESEELTQLRDTLLPKLLTGELSVTETKEQVTP